MTGNRQSVSPVYGVVAIAILVIMIWIAISAVRGVFAILSWLALPLFIVALVFNYRVVTEYIKWLWDMLKKDTVKGLIYTGLSVVGYPFVAAYMAFKAFSSSKFGNKSKSKSKKKKGEYLKYEEVEETEEDFLELDSLEEAKEKLEERTEQNNKYDDLF